MTREIKFRAWDRWEKRMLWRGVFDRNWYATEKSDEQGANTARGIKPEDRTELELMQFTGLKDKNGKEIYEGDIVEIKNNVDSRKAKIIYEGSCFSVEVLSNEELPKARVDKLVEIGIVEIIGNIWEHPQLLTP